MVCISQCCWFIAINFCWCKMAHFDMVALPSGKSNHIKWVEMRKAIVIKVFWYERKTNIWNQFLDQVRTRLNNICQELMVEEDLPIVAMLKNHFLGLEEQEKSILDVFDYHKKLYAKDFFETQLKKMDVYLSVINWKFITNFEYFIWNRKYLKSYCKACFMLIVVISIERGLSENVYLKCSENDLCHWIDSLDFLVCQNIMSIFQFWKVCVNNFFDSGHEDFPFSH